MPKHKKFIKSEKAKIQLKGAKLPKGLNVTKTEFKIKKIVLQEQIRDQFNEDGTVIRKQNVKELLTKLQHHNSTSRNEGLRYLKDMLTNHSDETQKHFGSIIHGIAQLSLDIDRDVRKESYRALGILLSTSTADTIQPFFDTLSSYLRCAMTHIQINIQEDSLFMLDNLLMFVPSLVAANSDKIFASFLDMISKLRIESKPERTLSLNLGSKLTSVKWRSKVLDRLLGMLKAMVNAKNFKSVDEMITNTGGDEETNAFNLAPEPMTTLRSTHINLYQSDKPMNFSIIRKNLNQNCELPLLFRKSLAAVAITKNDSYDEGSRIQKYSTLLLPLIFETWMEVRPASMGNEFDADSQISNEAAFSLKIILEIMEKIYELISMWDNEVNNHDLSNWFHSSYNKDFCTNFLQAFPYVQAEGKKSSKRKAKGMPTEQDVYESGGHKCYNQNLNILYIFCCLNNNLQKQHQHVAEKVISFLIKNIPQMENVGIEISNALVKVLRTILFVNGENWTRANVPIKELLATTIATYQQHKFPKEIRTKILILLCDIVLDWKLCQFYGNEIFDNWLASLPKLLLQPYISNYVLGTFSCLGKQQNQIFLNNLEENLPNILDNLSKIQFVGFDDQFEGKKAIINLFFWTEMKIDFDNRSITTIEDANLINYIKEILILKRNNKNF